MRTATPTLLFSHVAPEPSPAAPELPPMPDDMAAEQAEQWTKLEPRLASFLRVFCYIERETGDIYKLSQGKVMSGARGSIYDEASARRAVTPFGIESR